MSRDRIEAAKRALAEIPCWKGSGGVGPLRDVRDPAAFMPLEPELTMPALMEMGFTPDEIWEAVDSLEHDALIEVSVWEEGVSVFIYSRQGYFDWIKDPPTPPPPAQFIPTKMQKDILKALDGRALKLLDLEGEVRCNSRSQVNKSERPGGLWELMSLGLVKNRPGIGYYRPDAPPPSAMTLPKKLRTD